MQRIEMTAERREKAGKGVARKLRMEGKIPAVVYGEGESVSLILDPKEIGGVLGSEAGENALINLKISGNDGTTLVILRDFQKDPITGKILHADLFQISADKEIEVKVPIEIVGDMPAGVKEGGILQHNLREITIRCLPSLIPDRISVDPSGLAINQGIYIRELALDPKIRMMEDPDAMVVSVAAPISEAKLEELLAAPTKEVKEPELIGKAPEEEGEEVAGKAPEAKGGGEVKTESKEPAAKEAPGKEKGEGKPEKKGK